MKSDIYTEKNGIEHILAETERLGAFCKLSPSAKGKLRLLAEEMLSLTVRLFDELSYEFFIENEERRFALNLSAKTIVSSFQKEKLLSLSSRNENKATKGIFGRISGVFESLLMDTGEYSQIAAPYMEAMSMTPYWGSSGMTAYFSLSSYQNEMSKTAKKEDWDDLEKSIIAILAKDMVIGVKNKKVEMIAVIQF
jgi:hypothetical protein